MLRVDRTNLKFFALASLGRSLMGCTIFRRVVGVDRWEKTDVDRQLRILHPRTVSFT
jgi:hypothetical protein